VFVWFLILFCFAVSLFGIVQHFTSENEIYWLSWIHTAGDPFGPYANRNHFAGFLELTLPVSMAFLVFRGVTQEAFPLLTVLTIVPVSAMVLSGSRAGIIGLVFELLVLAILARSRRVSEVPHIGAIAIVGVVALSLVAWMGAGKAIERFSTAPLKDVSLARRISMFRGAAHVFLDYPVKGSGLGTLITIFPRYETAYDGYVIAHVHNDYIETLAETGVLGGLCGISFLWMLYRNSLNAFESSKERFSRALHAGAIVAVSGLLLHSFVDYNLHVPANALLFLLQVHLATSPALVDESQVRDADSRSRDTSPHVLLPAKSHR
jgi:O-antigen ligase